MDIDPDVVWGEQHWKEDEVNPIRMIKVWFPQTIFRFPFLYF